LTPSCVGIIEAIAGTGNPRRRTGHLHTDLDRPVAALT